MKILNSNRETNRTNPQSDIRDLSFGKLAVAIKFSLERLSIVKPSDAPMNLSLILKTASQPQYAYLVR
jgi:hypothetical protein